MKSIRIDKKILSFIKRSGSSSRIAGKTMAMIAAEAIYRLYAKPKECFSCSFHRDQLAGLETGRQSLAQNGEKKVEMGWLKVGDDVMAAATKFASSYGRNAQVVFEQALIEYLTMPSQCGECPNRKDPPAHG